MTKWRLLMLAVAAVAATFTAAPASAAASCTHTASTPTLGGGIHTTQSENCTVGYHANVFLQVETAGVWGSASFDDGSQALWQTGNLTAGNHDLSRVWTNIHQTPYCSRNWRIHVGAFRNSDDALIDAWSGPTLRNTCSGVAAASVAEVVVPKTATCANSFPADGHAGPWHTMVSGGSGTLHGNTVHVQCPSGDTHWSLDYSVQLLSNGNWQDIFQTHHQGNGTPFDFSDSLTPFPCSDSRAVFPLRTHVHNLVTGGSANKPGGGGFVHICGN